MTIILYMLLVYYLIQLCKHESVTALLVNNAGDLFKEGEEKNNKDKTTSGCILFLLVGLPLILFKLVKDVFLIYVIINGIKSGVLLYPSIAIGVIYIFNFTYGIVKTKINNKEKDKYSHVKTKRSFRGWINLILILIYIIWYLIVI